MVPLYLDMVEDARLLHDRDGFFCGNEALDNYLKRQARQDANRYVAAPFVAIAGPGDRAICGYYTLSAYGVDPGELPPMRLATGRLVETARLARRYQESLRRANALDFDDILMETVDLLRQAPDVAQRLRDRYEHVLIDEFQDTNRPQYELVRLLTQQHQNLCAVGDEDQSIYSWRGADIRNIVEFEKDYPQARILRLEENYRSTQAILDAASALVAHNKYRKGKTLWTDNPRGDRVAQYIEFFRK